MASRKKYHNVVVGEGGNKVHIACHNSNYVEAKCELQCTMAMLTMETINLVVMDSKEKVIFY